MNSSHRVGLDSVIDLNSPYIKHTRTLTPLSRCTDDTLY